MRLIQLIERHLGQLGFAHTLMKPDGSFFVQRLLKIGGGMNFRKVDLSARRGEAGGRGTQIARNLKE
jgi:hypothetical protein